MCIGLVGEKHSVLKTVLACLNLRGNLYVLLHGMGCVSRVACKDGSYATPRTNT